MKAIDFKYDGRKLSDFGFMICSFDGGTGLETVSDANLTFNTVTAVGGKRRYITDRVYENCIETTFQICKIPHEYNYNIEVEFEEVRALKRWLERKEFHKVKFIQEPFNEFGFDFFFEGAFNVSQIEIAGLIVGLELTPMTNRPFALHDPIRIKLDWTEEEISAFDDTGDSIIRKMVDISEEIGYCYPKMKVTCLRDGTFQISNNSFGKTTAVKNCKKDEVLTFEYPIIQSSITSHDLANDFNFTFLRLANKYKKQMNELEIELPCEIEFEYCPVVKVGF